MSSQNQVDKLQAKNVSNFGDFMGQNSLTPHINS